MTGQSTYDLPPSDATSSQDTAEEAHHSDAIAAEGTVNETALTPTLDEPAASAASVAMVEASVAHQSDATKSMPLQPQTKATKKPRAKTPAKKRRSKPRASSPFRCMIPRACSGPQLPSQDYVGPVSTKEDDEFKPQPLDADSGDQPAISEATSDIRLAPDQQEMRCDPTDGNWYSRSEFLDAYGGPAEWDAAAPSVGEGTVMSDDVGLVAQQSLPVQDADAGDWAKTESTAIVGSTDPAVSTMKSMALPAHVPEKVRGSTETKNNANAFDANMWKKRLLQRAALQCGGDNGLRILRKARKSSKEDSRLENSLPPNWGPVVSRSTGDTYYFNFVTGESTYEKPSLQ
eukprot:SAG31_NODE_273_length_18667_cov_3.603619_6_plen_346_part_00